jgi:hypothetical protein
MREIVVRFAALCGIAVWSVAASAAPTEVQLAMPFACHVDGGDVKLSPSQIQRYQVIGVPERQVFSACSPAHPNICRDWILHRFDIDCGGVRVPWLAVAGTLTTNWMPSRFWVSEGRLHLRMGPLWSGLSARPCFARRPLGYGPWRNRGPLFDAPCARASIDDPGQVITMPSGFAPMLSAFAHFEPQAETRQAASQPQGYARQPLERPAPPIASGSTGVLIGPVAKSMPSAKSGDIVDNTAPTSGTKSPDAHSDEEIQFDRRETAIDGPGAANQRPVEPLGVPANKLWFGLMAIMLIFAIWLLRHREDGTVVTTVAERGVAARASRPSPRAPLRPRPAPSTVPPMPKETDRLPSTRSEALQVLGASSETGEEMLKEIVRALRQKWHPDRARAEERPLREHRLKQINVAWDILRGKRAASRA